MMALPLCARRADFATHFSAAVRGMLAACSVPLASVPVGGYEMIDVPSLVGALRSTAAGSEAKKAALHFAHEWNDAMEDTAWNCHAAHALVLIVKAACALDRHGRSSLGLVGKDGCTSLFMMLQGSKISTLLRSVFIARVL